MGAFDGIESAHVGGQGTKLSLGRHLVKIKTMETFAYRKGNGNGLTYTYEVVQSGNAADPVGAVREYMQHLDRDSFGYVIKQGAALLGVDPSNKTAVESEVTPIIKKTMEAACSKEQIFAGTLLWVQVDAVKDKEDQTKIHHNHSFFPAEQPA